MAVVRQQVNASPDDVFAALADGWNYASWVVGASHIRDVDRGWPTKGSMIHHSIGVWPALIHDTTRVLDVAPGRRLVLQARGWPLGEARVALHLEPRDGGTLVTMEEAPSDGAAARLLRPLIEMVLPARNLESLRRLARLAEGKYRG